MSLLDDLRSLNIDGIVNARASIRASVEIPQLQAVVGAGAASSALGGLGGSLDSIRTSFPDAQSLLRPLIQALEGLGGRFDTGQLNLVEYADAVRDGMDFIVRLLSSLTGDPSDFGQIFGTPLAEAVRIAGDRSGQAASLFGARADSFADFGRMSSQNLRDVGALADLAADVLLPFPKANLRSMRDSIQIVLSASAELQLPSGRAQGLVIALDAVAVAAATGDPATLDAALRNVRLVREHMLGVFRDDLSFAVQQIHNLRVPQIMRPLADFSRTIRLGQQGVIEFLDDFRGAIAAVRAEMEDPDLDRVREFIANLPPIIEERARQAIEIPIDTAVERSKEFVRRTLRQLPVRDLRNEITKFLQQAAQTVQDANLDGPANAARDALADIGQLLDLDEITGQVQAALQQVNQTINDSLGGVIDALDTIQQQVDALAGQAEAILDRLAEGLAQFKAAIDAITAAVDGLGIEQVEQQLVEALTALRQSAEEILSNVPLPEPLRPQVEQLIELLEGVDFDEVLEPVRRAASEFRIPNDIAEVVENGLAEARRVVENLIPAELIASIQAEVNQALDTIRNFNPASLLPDVSQYLEQAASLIESMDPRAIAEQISGPFQTVLDVIDRVHPNRILAPVIEAYDSLLNQVPVPDAQNAATGLRSAFDTAGQAAGRAIVEPARRASGNAESEVADPQSQTPVAELPPAASEVRAGDAIRLLGYVPSRLRELLSALGAGPAGEVLRQVDALCAGLARQIREVQSAQHEMLRRLDESFEQLLIPLGPAQLRAHLAVQANFSTHASFQASLDIVALAGPGAIRREIADSVAAMRGAARDSAAATGGSAGQALERMAVALEQTPLARIGGDLQALLDALDVEPIAAELDALVARMIELTPQLVAELLPDMRAFIERIRALINHYNPGSQAQKFLAVLDVLREELDVLNPRRLAAELAEVHAAIRAAIAAYDPRIFAEEIAAITRNLAQQIRALNPQELLGDINFLQTTVDRIASANPATRLASVGQSLATVGERLGEIDLDALIESVNGLSPRLIESFENLIEAVRNEIVALLESLRFAVASGSASAQLSLG